jgi:hypothetical protein
MDLDVGWDCVEWVRVAQDRDQQRAVVNTVMDLQVPQKAGNFLSSTECLRIKVILYRNRPRGLICDS